MLIKYWLPNGDRESVPRYSICWLCGTLTLTAQAVFKQWYDYIKVFLSNTFRSVWVYLFSFEKLMNTAIGLK